MRGGGSYIEQVLYHALIQRWPGRVEREIKGIIPGRRFRLDMGFRPEKIGIEADGWRSHGLSKSGYARDREKDILYQLEGWMVLHFTTGQILKKMPWCLKMVGKAILLRGSKC